MTGKRVFISGVAGFIGFHLACHLCERGDHVLGYDNYNAYYDPTLKYARTEKLAKLGVSVINGDIQDSLLLQTSIEHHQTTHIVHLAAQAGVRYSIENPRAYLQSNIDGFLTLLEVCRLYPSIPLIYASSSSVYGLNKTIPFAINDQTDHQASFYGVTKKTNELMAHAYHHLYGIPVTGLRFFTVYGPWGRPDMAYFSFAKAITDGRPIEIYNYGDMRRDFTYIDDIIAGVAVAIDRSYAYAVFNLGNHRPEELMHLITLLEKELGRSAIKILRPLQAGDVISTYAAIDESTAALDFIPRISLEDGIAHFVKWFKNYYT